MCLFYNVGQGDNGSPGEKGDMGFKGEQGEPGTMGLPGTISLVLLTTKTTSFTTSIFEVH